MKIRHSKIEDLDTMYAIYERAKQYMIDTGNPNQWNDPSYPGDVLKEDIANGYSYIIEDDGEIVGTFVFIIGDDPTYQIIDDGEWCDNVKPYGTIHRIASSGAKKGVMQACLDWCFKQIDNVRIDTHEDNKTMLNIFEKNGFKRCGIIYLMNGDPRIAFQKIIQPEDKQ